MLRILRAGLPNCRNNGGDTLQIERQIERNPRIPLVDEMRGLAVFCMVFYHLFFVLDHFFHFAIGRVLFDFFQPLQPLFAAVFIVISGVSSRFSRSNFRRGGILLAVSIGFTAFTVYVFPLLQINGAQIYFGILHLLSVSMLLFACLRPLLDKLNPHLGFFACLLLFVLFSNVERGWFGLGGPLKCAYPLWLYRSDLLMPLGFHTHSFTSADYFPLFPFVFLFFAGSFLGRLRTPDWAYKSRIPPLALLGRLALPIYFLHQPLAYGISMLVTWIIR